ncbi:MAG: hypothetical protein K8R54_16335 [Bacteroidales bacterium]|nr:hypothetical protein [Bacteroidales bacterium]
MLSKLYSEISHIYVIGDFGRTATFEFCKRFIDEEKRIIENILNHNNFYDEYRRTMITVNSYLPLIKEKQIDELKAESFFLDDRILIGFPDGMSMDDAIDKFCIMLISFLLKSEQTSAFDIITLPCNTLSPALLKVQEIFNDHIKLKKIIKNNKISVSEDELTQILNNNSIRYITVAEAVINYLAEKKYKYVLPLGTMNISQIYNFESSKSTKDVNILIADENLQKIVFDAIKSCIKNSEKEMEQFKQTILREINKIEKKYNSRVAIVEACTDLKLGIGYNSLNIYAEYIAGQIYMKNSENLDTN